MSFEPKEKYGMDDVLELVALLRDPQKGCPWDKVQTHASIRKNLLEEAYEAADAIDLDDAQLLREELGDVLLQVALHTCMEQESGRFSFEDVCTDLCKKLVYRHPHIFGGGQAQNAVAALENWEQLKRREKSRQDLADDLASIPHAMPALMRAQKAVKRAAARGLGPAVNAADAKAMLRRAMEQGALAEQADRWGEAQVGELLLAVCALAQASGQDAEQALTRAVEAFILQIQGD